ncbi:MAG: class E sortase [Acidimicrobiales bacterium]
MKRGAWVGRCAVGLILLGLLILLFVAYQLWGTAFYAGHAQNHLRSQLSHQLHRSLPSISQVEAAGRHGGHGLKVATAVAGPMAAPPPGAPIGLLAIPKIGLEDAVVEGVGEPQLQQGPGHYPGTPLPGQWGNAAIAGHRTTYAHPFYNLNELQRGDPIYVLTAQGLFKYVVAQQFTVLPTDVAVLKDSAGRPTLTLTTCNPRYSAAQRLVVVADLWTGSSGATVSNPAGGGHAATGTNADRAQTAGDGALGGQSNGPVPAVLWGLATLAAVVVVLLLRRRLPGRARWLLSTAGSLGCLVLLFLFFEHLSLALPASF